jgi:hypothetical protein
MARTPRPPALGGRGTGAGGPCALCAGPKLGPTRTGPAPGSRAWAAGLETKGNPHTPEATPFQHALQDALTEAEAFAQPGMGPIDIAHPSEDKAGRHGTD